MKQPPLRNVADIVRVLLGVVHGLDFQSAAGWAALTKKWANARTAADVARLESMVWFWASHAAPREGVVLAKFADVLRAFVELYDFEEANAEWVRPWLLAGAPRKRGRKR